MRRFCVVSTVMGNDEKCLLLRVVLSAKILESCLFAAREGSDLKIGNPHCLRRGIRRQQRFFVVNDERWHGPRATLSDGAALASVHPPLAPGIN